MKSYFTFFSLLAYSYLNPAIADSLQDLAGSYNALAEDQFQFISQYFAKDPAQTERGLKAARQNLESAQMLENVIEGYLNGHHTPDRTLNILLETRFNYLNQLQIRHKVTRYNVEMTGSMGKYVTLATNPEVIQILKSASEAESEPLGSYKYNYELTLGNIDKYQTMNKLIIGIYQRHSLSDFSVATKHLLSASVTLHPLLAGISDDWSHPDAGVIKYNDDAAYFKDGKDFTYWSHCIVERNFKVTFMNWCRTHTTIKTTAERAGQSNVSLRYLGWLDLVEKEDDSKNSEAPSKTSQAEEMEMDKVIHTDSTNSSGTEPTSYHSESDEEEQGEEFESSDSNDGFELDEFEEDDPATASPKQKQSTLVSKKKNKVKLRRKRRDTSRKTSPSLNPTPQSSETYLPPRGLRAFHSSGFNTAQTSFEELNQAQRGTLERIFDPERFQNVKYREIESLWEAINGPNSIKSPGSGGSHRALLNTNGDVVGSTFTHGDNHTYTHRSIRYIRDAFIHVGLGMHDRK